MWECQIQQFWPHIKKSMFCFNKMTQDESITYKISRKSTLIFHYTQVQNVVKQTISKHISEAETIQWRQRQRVRNSKHCNEFVWSIHSGRKMNRQYNIQRQIGVLKDSPKRSKEMVWSKDLHYYHLHLHLKQNQLHSHLKWGHHCQSCWNSILLRECLQNGRQKTLEGRQCLVFEMDWHQTGCYYSILRF